MHFTIATLYGLALLIGDASVVDANKKLDRYDEATVARTQDDLLLDHVAANNWGYYRPGTPVPARRQLPILFRGPLKRLG